MTPPLPGRFTLPLLLAAGVAAFPAPTLAQLVRISSADSIDGEPRSSLAIGGWLKLHGVYDFSGTPYTWALSPPSIPVGDVERDPQLNLDMNQTRISFRAAHRPDAFPVLSAYVETDFFGGGGGELLALYLEAGLHFGQLLVLALKSVSPSPAVHKLMREKGWEKRETGIGQCRDH